MRVRVGSSGFAYDFWKGGFYPEDITSEAMLEFYASKFDAVEINNTFYRMPKPHVAQRWADSTPPDFRFVIKASRRITHQARLRDCQDSVQYLKTCLEPLGDKLGAVLFQLPPFLRKGTERLREFVACLPPQWRAVVEFRHRSWFCEEVYDTLRQRGVAMCIGDYEGKAASPAKREEHVEADSESHPSSDAAAQDEPSKDDATPMIATAPFGYVRLRDEAYDEATLQQWLDDIRDRWDEGFVFFKHEENAPTLIEQMRTLAARAPTRAH